MKISTEQQYQNALKLINDIMKKGEDFVSIDEINTLQQLTKQVEAYEQEHYAFSHITEVV